MLENRHWGSGGSLVKISITLIDLWPGGSECKRLFSSTGLCQNVVAARKRVCSYFTPS